MTTDEYGGGDNDDAGNDDDGDDDNVDLIAQFGHTRALTKKSTLNLVY